MLRPSGIHSQVCAIISRESKPVTTYFEKSLDYHAEHFSRAAFSFVKSSVIMFYTLIFLFISGRNNFFVFRDTTTTFFLLSPLPLAIRFYSLAPFLNIILIICYDIFSQQRIFALQIFELHRLIMVSWSFLLLPN